MGAYWGGVTERTVAILDRVSERFADLARRGVPATDADIAAAEATLGCAFPPSYRRFLQQIGGLSLPEHLGVVQHFVGVSDGPVVAGVVAQTLAARRAYQLADDLVVVGMGAERREWFCLDTRRSAADGECPVRLYDARDRALDGEFYADFGRMVDEVLGFVEAALDVPFD